jgi:phosphate transport system substrate-binding protein
MESGENSMNDDFLHRLRVAPRPQFVVELRARLQRQSEVQGFRRTGIFRSIRYLLPLALGCAFAVALVVTNGDRDRAAAPVSPPIQKSPASPPSQASQAVAPLTSAPDEKQAAKRSATTVFRIAGAASLLPSIQQISGAFKSNGTFSDPAFVAADSNSAVKALCDASGAAKADMVLLTRRILQQELDECAAHGVKHVAELRIAHEAVVLARSAIYEQRALSQREIYLALAKEIPDPHNPSIWVPNPNKTWNEVDSSLPAEQIDIVGPGRYSAAWMAFQDTVFQTGCPVSPEQLEYARRCTSVRDDGAYRPSPDDIRGYLDAHPNAMALVAYASFYPQVLRAVKLDNSEPTSQSVADGSYPGARTIYLYLDKSRMYAISRFVEFVGNLSCSKWIPPDSALTPQIESERQANHEVMTAMPDVKL